MRNALFAGLISAGAGLFLIFGMEGRGVAADAEFESSAGRLSVTPLVSGLDLPWAVAPVPGGGALITEQPGRLWLFDEEWQRREVSGVPEVAFDNQGGLLDVALAGDFAETGIVFLSFSEPVGRRARTSVVRAVLDREAAALGDVTVIFRQTPALSGGRHFGSRIVEAADGTLFVTTGDRGERDMAQDPDSHVGKVIRITRDGGVPGDNPYVAGGALPEIWSIGHRNIQGAALDETGQLWTLSHGARGGDEVNRPEPGLNYGWPVISYGRHYSGFSIGEGTAKAGMEQPKFYWDPSIAPSGLAHYDGALFPQWQGDLFAGSLKFDYIARLDREGTEIRGEERLFQGEYGRIRDIAVAPDGSLWFLAMEDGALYRIAPAE
ncbi:MAG: PQQ-dependent sugar dehydrogenase [Pseudomonadota bacterium]